MKLGEALAKRKELKTSLGQIQRELRDCCSRSTDSAEIDSSVLLAKFASTSEELASLEERVNLTNNATKVKFHEHEFSIMHLIAERDAAKLREEVYSSLLHQAKMELRRHIHDDREHQIKTVSDFDLEQLENLQTTAAKLYRELNVLLQEANWTTELV